MHTLAPGALTSPALAAVSDLLAVAQPADPGRTAEAVALLILVLVVALALRAMARAVTPVVELFHSFVSASLTALLMLLALILVLLMVTIGYA